MLEYRRALDQIGDERNQLRLLSGAWLKWTTHIKKEKRSQLLKYLEIDQIAFLHWQRYASYITLLFDGIVNSLLGSYSTLWE